MVDWEAVERLRAKGWDWDRIAGDARADFHAEEGMGEPGRALRALYYQRRSKQQRRPGPTGGGRKSDDLADRPKWSLARAGMILAPAFGVWLALALVFPSPVGTYLPAVPAIVIVFLVAVFVLAWGLLRAAEKWNRTLRTSAIVGVVLGFVVAGTFGLAAVLGGCPTLSSSLGPEPAQWEKAGNPAWQVNGAPVFLYYGSIACPYCSASSWAIQFALQKFGTLTGTYYDHSSLTDVYPGTPEVVLASAQLNSGYVSLDILESTDNTKITYPAFPSCTEQAYVSAYDSSGIPFVVVNGQYIHAGTLVDPSQLTGLNATTIQSQIAAQQGVAWNAVEVQGYFLIAYLVKANGGQPASLASDPTVAADLAQIT